MPTNLEKRLTQLMGIAFFGSIALGTLIPNQYGILGGAVIGFAVSLFICMGIFIGGLIYKSFSRKAPEIPQNENWKPVNKGGSSIVDQILVQESPTLIKIIEPAGGNIGYMLFVLLCLIGVLASFAFIGFQQYKIGIPTLIISLIILIITIKSEKRALKIRSTFDKETGLFWKSKDEFGDEKRLLLKEIIGLQIIAEEAHERGRRGKIYFNSHELNLVTKDKQRICLMDHENIEQIEIEGKTLSDFLGVPLVKGNI